MSFDRGKVLNVGYIVKDDSACCLQQYENVLFFQIPNTKDVVVASLKEFPRRTSSLFANFKEYVFNKKLPKVGAFYRTDTDTVALSFNFDSPHKSLLAVQMGANLKNYILPAIVIKEENPQYIGIFLDILTSNKKYNASAVLKRDRNLVEMGAVGKSACVVEDRYGRTLIINFANIIEGDSLQGAVEEALKRNLLDGEGLIKTQKGLIGFKVEGPDGPPVAKYIDKEGADSQPPIRLEKIILEGVNTRMLAEFIKSC